MAMRSIPAILRYCRLIEEHAAEDAILFNFTNPSGLVTEAIIKSGFKRRVYGICDAPSELIRELPAILGCEERDLSVECYGLNHFSWFTHFTVRGEEVTERLIASPELYQKTAMQYFSPELVRLCDNQLLNEYLYYYYYRDEALKAIQGPARRAESRSPASIRRCARRCAPWMPERNRRPPSPSGCSITYAGKTAICRTNPGRRNSTPANR